MARAQGVVDRGTGEEDASKDCKPTAGGAWLEGLSLSCRQATAEAAREGDPDCFIGGVGGVVACRCGGERKGK